MKVPVISKKRPIVFTESVVFQDDVVIEGDCTLEGCLTIQASQPKPEPKNIPKLLKDKRVAGAMVSGYMKSVGWTPEFSMGSGSTTVTDLTITPGTFSSSENIEPIDWSPYEHVTPVVEKDCNTCEHETLDFEENPCNDCNSLHPEWVQKTVKCCKKPGVDQKKKYICYAGYVNSADGDRHLISADRVARLYGLPYEECYLVNSSEDKYGMPEGCRELHPDSSGCYNRPWLEMNP